MYFVAVKSKVPIFRKPQEEILAENKKVLLNQKKKWRGRWRQEEEPVRVKIDHCSYVTDESDLLGYLDQTKLAAGRDNDFMRPHWEDFDEAAFKRKREICKFFAQGFCRYGERCHYAHSFYEIPQVNKTIDRVSTKGKQNLNESFEMKPNEIKKNYF